MPRKRYFIVYMRNSLENHAKREFLGLFDNVHTIYDAVIEVFKSGRYNVEISQTEISENLKITYDGFVYLDMVKTCLNDSSNVSSATYEFFNSFLFDKNTGKFAGQKPYVRILKD